MKYILIITDTDEGTSDLVIDWLINLKQKFYRINYETPIFIDYIKLENSSVHFKFTYQNLFNEKVTISSDDIKSIWYRRSNININTFDTLKSTHPKIINELNSNILNLKGDEVSNHSLGIDYNKVILDKRQNKFYAYSINSGIVALNKLNLKTGKTTDSYELKGVTFPKNLKIINGWAYFIKINRAEFHKLYRMSL